ncbi:MAG: hypothetical protein AABW99_01455 [archaeon]
MKLVFATLVIAALLVAGCAAPQQAQPNQQGNGATPPQPVAQPPANTSGNGNGSTPGNSNVIPPNNYTKPPGITEAKADIDMCNGLIKVTCSTDKKTNSLELYRNLPSKSIVWNAHDTDSGGLTSVFDINVDKGLSGTYDLGCMLNAFKGDTDLDADSLRAAGRFVDISIYEIKACNEQAPKGKAVKLLYVNTISDTCNGKATVQCGISDITNSVESEATFPTNSGSRFVGYFEDTSGNTYARFDYSVKGDLSGAYEASCKLNTGKTGTDLDADASRKLGPLKISSAANIQMCTEQPGSRFIEIVSPLQNGIITGNKGVKIDWMIKQKPNFGYYIYLYRLNISSSQFEPAISAGNNEAGIFKKLLALDSGITFEGNGKYSYTIGKTDSETGFSFSDGTYKVIVRAVDATFDEKSREVSFHYDSTGKLADSIIRCAVPYCTLKASGATINAMNGDFPNEKFPKFNEYRLSWKPDGISTMNCTAASADDPYGFVNIQFYIDNYSSHGFYPLHNKNWGIPPALASMEYDYSTKESGKIPVYMALVYAPADYNNSSCFVQLDSVNSGNFACPGMNGGKDKDKVEQIRGTFCIPEEKVSK